MTLHHALLVTAFMCFAVEGLKSRSLIAIGLACWILSVLVLR